MRAMNIAKQEKIHLFLDSLNDLFGELIHLLRYLNGSNLN